MHVPINRPSTDSARRGLAAGLRGLASWLESSPIGYIRLHEWVTGIAGFAVYYLTGRILAERGAITGNESALLTVFAVVAYIGVRAIVRQAAERRDRALRHKDHEMSADDLIDQLEHIKDRLDQLENPRSA